MPRSERDAHGRGRAPLRYWLRLTATPSRRTIGTAWTRTWNAVSEDGAQDGQRWRPLPEGHVSGA